MADELQGKPITVLVPPEYAEQHVEVTIHLVEPDDLAEEAAHRTLISCEKLGAEEIEHRISFPLLADLPRGQEQHVEVIIRDDVPKGSEVEMDSGKVLTIDFLIEKAQPLFEASRKAGG